MLPDERKIGRNRPIRNEGITLLSRIKDPGYPFALIKIKTLSAGLQALILNAAGDETTRRMLLPETRTAAAGTP
jgi:hypothetical protein